MRTDANTFRIPDLDICYDLLRDYVREHQGEKGYIDTSNNSYDTIYAICYDWKFDTVDEYRVLAVRVDDNWVEVLTENPDLDVDIETDSAEAVNRSEQWEPLRCGDVVYYVPTLFSICESIEEFV